MKTALTLTLALATSPLCSFGEVRGGAGPGGGNPSHVQEQASSRRSKFAESMIEAEKVAKAKEAQRFLNREKDQALDSLGNYSRRVNLYLEIFEKMGYPFSAEFKQNVNRGKVAVSLARIGDQSNDIYTNFSIDDSIELNGKPITFLSTPNLVEPSKGKLVMNAKLFSQQERTLKPWSIIATIFHEALRLQNIEESDSYPYSTEFALAMRDVYENKDFYPAMQRVLFHGCPLKFWDYQSIGVRLAFLPVGPSGRTSHTSKANTESAEAAFLASLEEDIADCGGRVKY